MKKYEVPVYIETIASMYIGNVECDDYNEFLEKREELVDKLEPRFPNYACNPFELGEPDLSNLKEEDMKYYKK